MPLPLINRDLNINSAQLIRSAALFDKLFPEYAGVLLARPSDDELESDYENVYDPDWVYLVNAHRYRNTKTGQIIGERQIVMLRDDFTDRLQNEAQIQADLYNSGLLSLEKFTLEMRELIVNSHYAEFMLGLGGYNLMFTDYTVEVSSHILQQFDFLQLFVSEIERGEVSPAQLRNRARLYMESATQAAERGRAAGRGIFGRLPAYPGDGTQICLMRCRCSWRFRNDPANSRILAYWTLRFGRPDGKNCATCLQNAIQWRPFILPT